MIITELKITNFRNLSNIEFNCNPKFNIIYGANGAGKTNFLEAIYYLSIGKSFRTHLAQQLLPKNSDTFSIFARVQDHKQQTTTIGIEYKLNDSNHVHIASKPIQRKSQLAKLLPMQFINSHSYKLLEQGPQYRRRFLDWSLFHVKQDFLTNWQKLQRILQQRNTLLRNKDTAYIASWDQELASVGNTINDMRYNCFTELQPLMLKLIQQMLGQSAISLQYHAGWDTNKDLQQLLTTSLQQDLRLGFTNFGPHRADLHFTINSQPIEKILSRGQQKLLLYAVNLAQGIYLYNKSAQKCIYLLDDLPSELDKHAQQLLMAQLQNIDAQVFITGINRTDLVMLLSLQNPSMFHVEQGRLNCC